MKTQLALAAIALTATSLQAALINLSDTTFTPDGSNTQSFNDTALEPLNGGSRVLPSSGTSAYVVSTFTFGASSDAHLRWQFYANPPTSAGRIGLEIQDNGNVSIQGISSQRLDYDGLLDQLSPGPSPINISPDMAGQTVTVLAKLQFDSNNSNTYDVTFNNGPRTPHGGADTLMNVWFNPTGASVEGAGPAAGDLFAIWNSSGFGHIRTSVFNQNTPGTAGDSSITDTWILTGNDATFANALAIAAPAAIPEPSSTALLGLGGLALILRRRRA